MKVRQASSQQYNFEEAHSLIRNVKSSYLPRTENLLYCHNCRTALRIPELDCHLPELKRNVFSLITVIISENCGNSSVIYSDSIDGSKSTFLHFFRNRHEEVVEDLQDIVEEERVLNAFLQNKLLKLENNY